MCLPDLGQCLMITWYERGVVGDAPCVILIHAFAFYTRHRVQRSYAEGQTGMDFQLRDFPLAKHVLVPLQWHQPQCKSLLNSDWSICMEEGPVKEDLLDINAPIDDWNSWQERVSLTECKSHLILTYTFEPNNDMCLVLIYIDSYSLCKCMWCNGPSSTTRHLCNEFHPLHSFSHTRIALNRWFVTVSPPAVRTEKKVLVRQDTMREIRQYQQVFRVWRLEE